MNQVEKRIVRSEKETIHSGHFMISQFEAEAQDDYDDLVTVPDEEQNTPKVSVVATYTVPASKVPFPPNEKEEHKQHQQLSIEVSLTKLFKCMTLAYRQKLTSPKWNRFKGIKLRWKDKIRLNNVIWRCWHMQFIKKQNTLVCQFASPLDVDTHVKPETTILEGKYWKRRVEAVIAEYKKWRKFHIMRLLGKGDTSVQDTIADMDTAESQCSDLAGNMLTDEDYLNFMTDTLFSTITNHQPFAFPDCREIAKGASLADFIQPSLGPLQPNLDDFMDTLEPLQEFLTSSRLPPVPEESTLPSEDLLYRSGMSAESYNTQSFITEMQNSTIATMPTSQMAIHGTSNNSQMMQISEQSIKNEQLRMYDNNRLFAQTDMQNSLISTQEMLSSFQTVGYDQHATQQADSQVQASVYTGKTNRMQYVNTPKAPVEPNYNKYSAAIPPSQTAPETVSLLQQPVQNSKYASTIVIQGRSGYNRDKPRSRVGQYQMQNSQYHAYGQPSSQPAPSPVSPQSYEARPAAVRQPAAQVQYLQPNPADSYKGKAASPSGNPRSFKMPSPPASVAPQQVPMQQSDGSTSTSSSRSSGKEQYRSHSLPLGAQLNPDWTVSAPPAPAPSTSEPCASKHAARAREPLPGAIRMRSRSTSGGSGGVQSEGGGPPPRRAHPPPLSTAASEPTLPHASVMLAHLLSARHSQSLYKLNSNEDVAGSSDPTKSPIRRGQPSPIGSDVMSPLQSVSPPTSPGSPRRTHLHAEQKRRYNIKNGFDTLQALIPHLNVNPGAKISKAAMLQKGAEYIKQLKAERNQLKEEMESLRQQIECLHNSISNCHSLLPATGAPVSRARAGRLREMFARHVANRTLHNWKYWLTAEHTAHLMVNGYHRPRTDNSAMPGAEPSRCLPLSSLYHTVYFWYDVKVIKAYFCGRKTWVVVYFCGRKTWVVVECKTEASIALTRAKFSVVSAALVESFSACVSCGSGSDLVRTTLLWAEQHCSLVEMRPAVLNSLRVLCTTTDILTNPERLPDEARAAVAAGAAVKTEPS